MTKLKSGQDGNARIPASRRGTKKLLFLRQSKESLDRGDWPVMPRNRKLAPQTPFRLRLSTTLAVKQLVGGQATAFSGPHGGFLELVELSCRGRRSSDGASRQPRPARSATFISTRMSQNPPRSHHEGHNRWRASRYHVGEGGVSIKRGGRSLSPGRVKVAPASLSRFICQEIVSGFAVVAWSGNGRASFSIRIYQERRGAILGEMSRPKPQVTPGSEPGGFFILSPPSRSWVSCFWTSPSGTAHLPD